MSAHPKAVDRINQLLGPTLQIQETLGKATHRPGQVKMAQTCYEVFSKEDTTFGVIQAPTGSGKSMAAGIPAAVTVLNDPNCRVLWSTASKALQNQLVNKDLPALKKLFPQLKYMVIYGRENYFSVARLEDLMPSNFEEQSACEEASILKNLLPRLKKELKDGTIEELRAWWDRHCGRRPLHKATLRAIGCLPGEKLNGFCFYQEALRKANASQLVVTNHHLLLSLAMYKDCIWPAPNPTYPLLGSDYKAQVTKPKLIIDECHELVDIVAGLTSVKTSSDEWKNWLQNLSAYCPNRTVLEQESNELTASWNALKPDAEGIDPILKAPKDLIVRTEKWIAQVRNIAASAPQNIETVAETNIRISNASALFAKLRNVGPDNKRDFFDLRQDFRKSLHWEARPFDVTPILKELLTVCSSGAVLTSATAHYGNAEHTLEHYGLSNVADRATVLELPSPFNLKENTKAFVAQHISHKDDGIPDFAEMCGKITEMLEGRTLALFTSYKALKQTKEALEQNLKGKNIKILTQQAGQPAILLIEQLKRDPHCIVLATSALWTGIDIPGDHLSAVLVHKLPFDVPDRYTKEMAEYLFAARGINHFRDVSVPMAINRLLQGIGRLVRTEEDRGIVIIADNRCQSATYGSEFKHALKNYNWRSISKTSELPSPEELRVYCRIPAKNMAKMR